MSELHVVTGAGPVGWTVAEQLAEQGHRVRVLTRSGSGPQHPSIERVKVDVSQADQLAEAFEGAVAVFHCIHGSAYSADAWRAELPKAEKVVLDAAGRVGAVVVFPESLYSYGKVAGTISEDTPRNATEGKLGIRTELLRGRAASSTPTVSVIASDFYGPRVVTAHAGERMVPTILDGKTMRVLGSLDQPHSFTYIGDYAAAMIAAAHDRSTWNTVLHAPTAAPVTQRALIRIFADAAGVPAPKMSVIPTWALRAVGLVSKDSRELAEMVYQFDKPFVMDSTRAQQLFGTKPTPMADAALATVEWWKAQRAGEQRG